MISLHPLNTPPGPLPDIRRDYPADRAHYALWRRGYQIEFILIHSTQGTNSLQWLSTTSDPPVSIHKLVRGPAVYAIVPPAHTAWHAGVCLPGYEHMNERSLGVEVENPSYPGGPLVPYSDADYNSLAQTVAGWMFSYGRGWDRVLRHADVAAPLGRKTDPDNLDMARVQRETYAWLRFMTALPVKDRGAWII